MYISCGTNHFTFSWGLTCSPSTNHSTMQTFVRHNLDMKLKLIKGWI